MKNLIRILLYLLLVLLVVAIAFMIYKRSKTPVDDTPPTSELTDSLFMDQQQHGQTALTLDDSMVLDLTGELPEKVGAPAESQLKTQKEPINAAPNSQNNGTMDYSQPLSPTEQSAAINTSPKAQKVSEKTIGSKAEAKPSVKVTTKIVAKPTASTKASAKPNENKSEAKKPATIPKPSASAGFYVVSGSFIVPGHADDQVKKLKKLGYKTAMKKVFGSSEYYSAVVGSYNNRQEAEKIISKLTAKGEKAFLKAK